MTNARKQEWIAKMSGRLTDEDLVAIEDASRRASPAPWILAVTPEEWGQEEIAANQTKMVREGGARAHFCIHPEDAEAQQARVTAFCGNGPTSEANARFIEIAVVAVPMLVREIRRLRALSPVESPGEEGAALAREGKGVVANPGTIASSTLLCISCGKLPPYNGCTALCPACNGEPTPAAREVLTACYGDPPPAPRPAPSAPAAAESTRAAKVDVEIIRGVEGLCVAVNGTRIAGAKPWGGGKVVESWEVDAEDVRETLPAAAPREVEEVRAFIRDVATNWDCDTGANGAHHHACRVCAAARLSSFSGESPERGDALPSPRGTGTAPSPSTPNTKE